MAIIVRDPGLLFVLTPHTASSAVGRVLREQLGGEWLPREHIRSRAGKVVVRTKHSTVRDLVRHSVIGRSELRDLHVFTTVRNPFDRLVTAYHKRRDSWAALADDPESWAHFDGEGGVADLRFAAEHAFDEWVTNRYLGSPVRRAAAASGMASMYRRFTRDADTVMRFEAVQRDLDEVLGLVGVASIEIEEFNPTTQRPADYRDYYDPATRRLVERAFRWDLRTFDYGF